MCVTLRLSLFLIFSNYLPTIANEVINMPQKENTHLVARLSILCLHPEGVCIQPGNQPATHRTPLPCCVNLLATNYEQQHLLRDVVRCTCNIWDGGALLNLHFKWILFICTSIWSDFYSLAQRLFEHVPISRGNLAKLQYVVSCWRCQLRVALFMKLSPGGQSISGEEFMVYSRLIEGNWKGATILGSTWYTKKKNN